MRAPRLPLIALCVVAFAASSPPPDAAAHAGAPPEPLDVLLHPEDATALSLEASFGLLLQSDSEAWEWLCHETIVRPGAFLTPDYARNGAGVLLATIGVLQQGQDPQESMYRSTDGCDWSPTGGTRDQVVTALAFDPKHDDVALAVTGNLTVGASNGILRSTDAGATFAATSVDDVDERIFRSILLSPAGSGGEESTAWVTANWFGPLGAWVYRSADGGETWEEHPQDLSADGERQILIDIVEVHPTDPLVAWLRVDGSLSDQLLRTDDGGVSFLEVFRVESDIRDVARQADGALWVSTVAAGLFRAADGESFAEVQPAPVVTGLAEDTRGVHLATADLGNATINTTQDGSEFVTAMVWDQLVGPLQCADGTDAATFCDPNWEVVELALGRGGDDDDSAPGDDDDDDDDSAGVDPGCCPDGASLVGAPAGPSLALWAIAVLGLRRRRVRSPG